MYLTSLPWYFLFSRKISYTNIYVCDRGKKNLSEGARLHKEKHSTVNKHPQVQIAVFTLQALNISV